MRRTSGDARLRRIGGGAAAAGGGWAGGGLAQGFRAAGLRAGLPRLIKAPARRSPGRVRPIVGYVFFRSEEK